MKLEDPLRVLNEIDSIGEMYIQEPNTQPGKL